AHASVLWPHHGRPHGPDPFGPGNLRLRESRTRPSLLHLDLLLHRNELGLRFFKGDLGRRQGPRGSLGRRRGHHRDPWFLAWSWFGRALRPELGRQERRESATGEDPEDGASPDQLPA